MNGYLKQALIDHPEGAWCAKCGGVNTFCDDIGWFYNYLGDRTDNTQYEKVHFETHYKAVCENCNTMPPGDR